MGRTIPEDLDLNDLRVFERVATLLSFTAAARALSQPKSRVSRGVARLEAATGVRLINRTTRAVELTQAGESLLERCGVALGQLTAALDFVGGLASEPRGDLRVSAGIGFGINVLAEQIPIFIRKYPEINIQLDLTSRPAELVAERVDVAIRIGALPDSSMMAVRLGEMKRYLCASPAYLDRRGAPMTMAAIVEHDVIEFPGFDGRPRIWSFAKDGQKGEVAVTPKITVNDALTIVRLVRNGAGLGIISGYLCGEQLASGTLVNVLSEWRTPSLAVNLVFPSNRQLAPAVRAFVDFMKQMNSAGAFWQYDGPRNGK